MTPIILTLIAVAIVAVAVVRYRNHQRLLGSLALVVAVAFALMAYWSAETIEENDDGDTDVNNGAPTAPPMSSTPGP